MIAHFLVIFLSLNSFVFGAEEKPQAPPSQVIAPTQGTFTTSDGVTIVYDHYAAPTKARGVLLLHMLGAQRRDWQAVAEELVKAGVGVMAIDFRGHGDSLKKHDQPIFYREFKNPDWIAVLEDVRAAVKEMKSLKYEIIEIGGASIGANIALTYAAGDSTIQRVALLSPGLNYHGFYSMDSIKKYKNPLWIAVSKEDVSSYMASQKLYQNGPQDTEHKSILIVDGKGHGTRMLPDPKVLSSLTQFFSSANAR